MTMSATLPKDPSSRDGMPAPLKSTVERIAVIGLGYVGLPLCVGLARHHASVAGYDISLHRVENLLKHVDHTGEVDGRQLQMTTARLSANPNVIADASFYIVTVPTPIDANKRPDLGPLRSACEIIGARLKPGDVVVFESTVYPGVTEEFCGPLLEKRSGLKMTRDFHLGYSPERINPGDKKNSVETVVKVVSGDTPETLRRIVAVYGPVIQAGLHLAPSIKVAECAKVIENTQRDVNIALMNELAAICDRINVRTTDVLEAAATKWNFLAFKPGLVGGHCISVDPYYLADLAEQVGIKPDIIRAGRRVNEAVAGRVAFEALARLRRHRGSIEGARIGIFGLTFKEDVPDLRNSKTIEIIEKLRASGADVLVHDPLADPEDARSVGVTLSDSAALAHLDLMIVAVAHQSYRCHTHLTRHLRPDGVLIDVKSIYAATAMPETISYWSL